MIWCIANQHRRCQRARKSPPPSLNTLWDRKPDSGVSASLISRRRAERLSPKQMEATEERICLVSSGTSKVALAVSRDSRNYGGDVGCSFLISAWVQV
jgi:hypothetical protein